MARPRSTPPAEQPQAPPQAVPSGPVADSLGLATGAAAVAPAGAGAVSAVAITAATEKILASLFGFFAGRRKDDSIWLRGVLQQDYPQRTPQQIETLVSDELERQFEFERKTKERLERDLPKALAILDPEKRQQAVNKILDREKRYLAARQQAMTERASARAEHMDVKAASPTGAFWALDPTVKQHTFLCLLYGNKAWPWEVLDQVHPVLHAGCQCHLLPLGDAKQRGLLPESHEIDKADAVKTARAWMARYGTVEADARPGEIEAFVEMRLEEASKGPRVPQACHYFREGCKNQATKSLIWADRRAFIPVCDAHEQKARKAIADQHDEVLDVWPIQEAKHNPAYERETAQIRERAETPKAKARHPFRAAEWTHPNGHPRCLLCGQEEPVGGICNGTPTKVEAEAWVKRQNVEDERLGMEPTWAVDDRGKVVTVLSEAEYEERQHPRGRGGRWVRKGVEKALRAITPSLGAPGEPEHRAPLQERGSAQGRYVWLRGRYVFVPRQRKFHRKLDHVTFTSPAGSTNVYRNGHLVQIEGQPPPPHHHDLNPPVQPDIRNLPGTAEYHPAQDSGVKADPGEHDSPIAGEHVDAALAAIGAQEDNRDLINQRVQRSLHEQSPDFPPVRRGDYAAAAADMLELNGFTSGAEQQTGTTLRLTFHHHPSGASVEMEWNQGGEQSVTGGWKVTDTKWSPGRRNWEEPPAPLDHPPHSWEEFADEVRGVAYRLADEHGAEPVIGEVHIARPEDRIHMGWGESEPFGDHAGTHNSYTGEVVLGPEVEDVLRLVKATAAGVPPGEHPMSFTPNETTLASAYASYKVAVHEALHAAGNVIDPSSYRTGHGKALEEAIVEELAHIEAAKLIRAHGADNVLGWARANPLDRKAQGTYHVFRRRLDVLLNLAKVAPEQREDYIRDLRWNYDTRGRLQKLARDVERAQGGAPGEGFGPLNLDADIFVRDHLAFGGNDMQREAEFVPILRPDLNDYPSPAGVLWNDKPIRVGTIIEMESGERVNGRWRKKVVEAEVLKVEQSTAPGFKFKMDVRNWDTWQVSHNVLDASIVRVVAPGIEDPLEGDPAGTGVDLYGSDIRVDGKRATIGALIRKKGEWPAGRPGAWRAEGPGLAVVGHQAAFGSYPAYLLAVDPAHPEAPPSPFALDDIEVIQEGPKAQRVNLGDVIRYDGRADGGFSEARVTAVHVLPQLGSGLQSPYAIEATTTENSLKPGVNVVLTPERMNGVSVVQPDNVVRLPERVQPQPIAVAADQPRYGGLAADPGDDYRGGHTAPDAEPGSSLDDPTNAFGGDDIYGPNGLAYYGSGGPAAHQDAETRAWAARMQKADMESLAAIRSARGKPDKIVTVYRAVPRFQSNAEKGDTLERGKAYVLKHGTVPPEKLGGWGDDSNKWYDWAHDEITRLRNEPEPVLPQAEKINPGDWVTPSRMYAKIHGESNLEAPGGGYDAPSDFKILSAKVRAGDLYTDGDLNEWGWSPAAEKADPGSTPVVPPISDATRAALRGDSSAFGGPLPMQNGLYYRFHAKEAPFGPEHATSRNLVSDEDLAGMSPEIAAIVGRTSPGYSAFWNPHHLDQYLAEMHWDAPGEVKGRQVIAFHGVPVGGGGDGEPLVMPSSTKVEKRMSLSKFRDRLEVTPNGYGLWDEHTWGDGPDGQIADDGYRTLGQISGEKADPGTGSLPGGLALQVKRARTSEGTFIRFVATHGGLEPFPHPPGWRSVAKLGKNEAAALTLEPGGGRVASVFVRPEWRRQGVATALLRAALAAGHQAAPSETQTSEGKAWRDSLVPSAAWMAADLVPTEWKIEHGYGEILPLVGFRHVPYKPVLGGMEDKDALRMLHHYFTGSTDGWTGSRKQKGEVLRQAAERWWEKDRRAPSSGEKADPGSGDYPKFDKDGVELHGGERVVLRGGQVWTVGSVKGPGSAVSIYKKDKATAWQMKRKIVRPSDIQIAHHARGEKADPGSERLSLENTISVAENVLERAGLDGGEMVNPTGHPYHPSEEGRAASAKLTQEAQAISGDPRLRAHISDWISGPSGKHGIAAYDRVYHTVTVRPVSNRLSFLHEIAHAMTGTTHGDGHTPAFARTARDLYGRHIAPEAGDQFWRLVQPKVEEVEQPGVKFDTPEHVRPDILATPRDEYVGEYPNEGDYNGPLTTAYRQRKEEWDAQMRHALALGRISLEDAQARGYHASGHESASLIMRGGVPIGGWQPLPEKLWHTTTAASAVRAQGLKSRAELLQERGAGLGGGDDETISFTTEPKIAEDIRRGLLEMRRVARGEITPQDMIDRARSGEEGSRPFLIEFMQGYQRDWAPGDPLPPGIEDAVKGVKRGQYGVLPDIEKNMLIRLRQEDPGAWRLREGSKPVIPDAPKGAVYVAQQFERPLTRAERAEVNAELYKRFLAWREFAGGPSDPVFFLADTSGLANLDPADIQVLQFEPVPGAQGYPLSGMKEWRTTTGQAVRLAGQPIAEAPIVEATVRVKVPSHVRDEYADEIDTLRAHPDVSDVNGVLSVRPHHAERLAHLFLKSSNRRTRKLGADIVNWVVSSPYDIDSASALAAGSGDGGAGVLPLPGSALMEALGVPADDREPVAAFLLALPVAERTRYVEEWLARCGEPELDLLLSGR